MLVPTEEEVKLEEGVDDLLQEQTGENDPYDMSIAPIFIYENQMLPIGMYIYITFRKVLDQIWPRSEFYRLALYSSLNGNSKKETMCSNFSTTSSEK